MKLCSDCKQTKPFSEFASHPRAKYQCRCKTCQRIVSKQWYKANKERQSNNVKAFKQERSKAFKQWKKTLQCVSCGESHTSCLDFHHTVGKDFDISTKFKSVSFETLVAELNKCIVLCSNCHRKAHDGAIPVESLPLLLVTVETFTEFPARISIG